MQMLPVDGTNDGMLHKRMLGRWTTCADWGEMRNTTESRDTTVGAMGESGKYKALPKFLRMS